MKVLSSFFLSLPSIKYRTWWSTLPLFSHFNNSWISLKSFQEKSFSIKYRALGFFFFFPRTDSKVHLLETSVNDTSLFHLETDVNYRLSVSFCRRHQHKQEEKKRLKKLQDVRNFVEMFKRNSSAWWTFRFLLCFLAAHTVLHLTDLLWTHSSITWRWHTVYY